MTLADRRIVLCVSGGIAAYKAVEVCRRLVDAGAHVQPLMTEAATKFVGTATFSALASEPVKLSVFDDPDDPIPHTTIGQQADLVLVAPATARLIGSYAAGISDDIVTTTLIATTAPVVLCPAMHTEMWEHAAVVDNLALLTKRGVHVVPPGDGRLAGGDIGTGRMAEPADIVAAVVSLLGNGPLANIRIVVSAGGTREPIDPVRFLGNRSTGKQGHALAAEAARRGAEVVLVSASSLEVPVGVKMVAVDTALEMRDAVIEAAAEADAVIMAAAVADFRPADVAAAKLKKNEGIPSMTLVPNPDILAELGENRAPGQVLVGFAAETDDLVENARAKLTRKNVDMIVANDVSEAGAGFGHDTNHVVIVTDADVSDIPLTAKRSVAAEVLDRVERRLAEKRGASQP